MSTPFLCELRMVSFNFAPKGWVQCNAQLLPINQNQAIFSLLGTTYGGNGQTNFGLPDLRGRVPIHMGQGHTLGEVGGQVSHTLTQSEMAAHTHPLSAINAAQNNLSPQANMLANTSGNLGVYGPFTSPVAMAAADITSVGGSQPHNNQSPYLVMNWIIALQGIFPSQN